MNMHSVMKKCVRLFIVMTILMVLSSPINFANELPFTGEELFKGIFFGTGPVRQLLPEFWNRSAPPIEVQWTTREGIANELQNSSALLQQEGRNDEALVVQNLANAILDTTKLIDLTAQNTTDTNLVNAIVADIALSDPTFFSRFGQNIQSGNHALVADAMREASRNVLEVIDPQDPGLAVDVYVERNAVINLNLAVSEHVAAVFYGAVEIALYIGIILIIAIVIPVINPSGGGNLEFDMAVDTITSRFDPNMVQTIPALSQTGALILILAFIVILTIIVIRRLN